MSDVPTHPSSGDVSSAVVVLRMKKGSEKDGCLEVGLAQREEIWSYFPSSFIKEKLAAETKELTDKLDTATENILVLEGQLLTVGSTTALPGAHVLPPPVHASGAVSSGEAKVTELTAKVKAAKANIDVKHAEWFSATEKVREARAVLVDTSSTPEARTAADTLLLTAVPFAQAASAAAVAAEVEFETGKKELEELKAATATPPPTVEGEPSDDAEVVVRNAVVVPPPPLAAAAAAAGDEDEDEAQSGAVAAQNWSLGGGRPRKTMKKRKTRKTMKRRKRYY